MRNIRASIYNNPASNDWFKKVEDAQKHWAQAWEKERADWMPALSDYLKNAQLETLRDICASHDFPAIKETNPPTSHDLNYGNFPALVICHFLFDYRTTTFSNVRNPVS